MLALAALLGGCGPRPSHQRKGKPRAEEQAPEKAAVAPVRLKQRSMSISLSDEKGQPIFEASAASLEVDENTKTGRMQNPRFTFYDAGKVAMKARSGSVIADYAKKIVHLDGGVEGDSEASGYSFRADRAQWDYDKKELRAWGGVRFWRKEWEAKGEELVGDTALKRARLIGSPATLRIAQRGTEKPKTARGRQKQ